MTTFFDLLFMLIILGLPASVAITWIRHHYRQLIACDRARLEHEYQMRALEIEHEHRVLALPSDSERK